MSEHTPGPWKVSRAIWDEDTHEVAYIIDGVYLADANTARLIAAAPRLLKALDDLVLATRLAEIGAGDIPMARETADRVIAEALGKQAPS